MKFFKKRRLVCLSLSYIIALFISAYMPTNIRVPIVSILLLILVAIACALIIRQLSRRQRIFAEHRLILSCIFCAVVALILPVFMFNIKNSGVNALDGKRVSIRAEITKLNAEENEYASFNARVYEADGNECDFTLLVFCEFSPQIKNGDIFLAKTTLTDDIDPHYYPEAVCRRSNILYSAVITSEDDFEVISQSKSFTYILDTLSRRTGYRLERLFSYDTANLAKALLLGDKHELPGLLSRDFGRAGISHLLALSGMHLALMTGFIIGSLKPIVKSRKIRFILTSLLAAFIMIFTGGSASIVRAALMLIHYQAGNLIRDRADIVTSLFAVTAGILAIDPYSVFDAGLILSFSATLGIVLTLEFTFTFSSRLFGAPSATETVRDILRVCFQGICISFFASLFVNVPCFFLFDRISLLSIFTTLLFTPLIAVFMLFSSLALILSAIHMSAFPCALAEVLYSLTEKLCSRISELDNIMISTNNPLLCVYTGLLISFFTFCVVKDVRLSHFATGALCLYLMLLSGFAVYTCALSFDTQLHIIAKEKDSGFFISNRHTSAYVDVSYGSSDINNDASIGVCEHLDTELDYYVITHFHFDHASAIRKFNEYTLIRKLLLPVPQSETDILYADMITETAERAGIEYEYFNSQSKLELCNISFSSLDIERKNKSSHPYVTLLFECEDENIVYTSGMTEKSASFEAFKSIIGKADTVIVSTHPKCSLKLSDYTNNNARILSFGDTYSSSGNEISLPYCICALIPGKC